MRPPYLVVKALFYWGRLTLGRVLVGLTRRFPEIRTPENIQKLNDLNEKCWEAESHIKFFLEQKFFPPDRYLFIDSPRKMDAMKRAQIRDRSYRLEIKVMDVRGEGTLHYQKTVALDAWFEIELHPEDDPVPENFPFKRTKDYKPWPQLPDLTNPYHFLLGDLLTQSPSVLARMPNSNALSFEIIEERKWQLTKPGFEN